MSTRAAWALLALLAYALAGAAWAGARAPLAPEEARALLVGREVLAAGAPACRPAGAPGVLAAAACAWPGAAVLAAAAWAERLGGLPAARLAGALAAAALVLLLFRAGESPPGGGRGPVVAATFVLLGVPLPLLATAHPRALAALLLGMALALAGGPLPGGAGPRTSAAPARAALAGVALVLAVASTGVAVLFAAPLALAIAGGLALGRRDRASAAAFALGLLAALAAWGWLAVRPAWPALREALAGLGASASGTPPARPAEVLDGIAMPLLLSTFALFHRDGRGRAAAAMAVACAAFLVPLASPGAEDARTARLLAHVVLAPAAGLGVVQMSALFSAGNPSPRARPLFAAAVLVILWVFGIHETRTLRRDGADLSQAVAFLSRDGAAGRTVLVESDSGSPEWVYRYYLEAATPPARVVPIARAGAAERREAVRAARPDYVVLDELHGERSFATASREYLGQGFAVAATFRTALGSGARSVQVLRREAR